MQKYEKIVEYEISGLFLLGHRHIIRIGLISQFYKKTTCNVKRLLSEFCVK